MAGSGTKNETALHSLMAGAVAGGVEGFITYPAEFVKSRSQLLGNASSKAESPMTVIRNTLQNQGVRAMWTGASALVIGNAVKAGVRFLSYDQFKILLRKEDGSLSTPRMVLAGLGSGTLESIFAVTPSETIKTKMIDDAKRAQPRFRSMPHAVATIIREEGFFGIYRGLLPVVMRQSANAAVRFTTYSALKQFVAGNTRPGSHIPNTITFAIGSLAGIVTVYSTQPLDCIKTRMQSLNANRYKNSADCVVKMVREEGVLSLWKGTTPRLARLSMSGGIVFTIYEAMMKVLGDR